MDRESSRSRRDVRTGSSSSSRAEPNPAVESAVTRLLVAIKQLLESLTQWSKLEINENQVSDVYVTLGNDFNAAVAAFAVYNIDMSELLSVPEDLRAVLEQCLAEDATSENLEIYLPTVRSIITNLLQGLRAKQSIYRRIVSDARNRASGESTQPAPVNPQPGGLPSAPRAGVSSRSSRSRRVGDPEPARHRSQLSRARAEDDGYIPPLSENAVQPSVSRRIGGPRRQVSSTHDEPFAAPGTQSTTSEAGSQRGSTADPSTRPSSSTGSRRVASGMSSHIAPIPETSVEPLPPPASTSSTPAEQAQPVVPAHVKRYSLVDGPVVPLPPADSEPEHEAIEEETTHDTIEENVTEAAINGVDSTAHPAVVEPSARSASPDSPLIDATPTPLMAKSLAALRTTDTLERRASKRFSTYNISRMTAAPSGGHTRERSTRGTINRRSIAAGANLTPGELNVLVEDDEEPHQEEVSKKLLRTPTTTRRTPSTTPTDVRSKSPVDPPFMPPVIGEGVGQAASPSTSHIPAAQAKPPVTPEPGGPMVVYLQLGREVKKTTVDPGLSIASLRVLFVDKFSYNPGQENFPAVYIQDPSSGVRYELEDMDEIRSGCLLSLNIEPLDQIKQHIDTQMLSLSKDIKELKTALNSRPAAPLPPPIIAHDFSESTPTSTQRPTEKEFAMASRRLSRVIAEAPSALQQQLQPQATGSSLQIQLTGGSMFSDYSGRIVSDLKTQFDEVQNLRRDLGVMRQLYTDFMKNTKESLGSLRTQTQSVRALAIPAVGGARGYIDSGKQKLDTRSQTALTKVEALQDAVEGIKEDVIKRHVNPKPQVIKSVKGDIDLSEAELQSLSDHIKTIKPMWKKTWEEELQNIVEEQQFLTHQEEFLEDLLEDHKAVREIYGHVEKVISIRGSGKGKSGLRKGSAFRPPPMDEGHTGLSTVMLEIRGAASDPERRMKAIEANQKNRERELASRSDEFQEELSGFVEGSKLRKTGGAEEAERVRQRKNDLSLKAMFSTGATPTPNGLGGSNMAALMSDSDPIPMPTFSKMADDG